jgi:hypothetical protein
MDEEFWFAMSGAFFELVQQHLVELETETIVISISI